MKKILMTGAAGVVGTFLRNEFRGRYHLRLTDMTAIDDCGPDEEFVKAHLSNLEATQNAVTGVEGIIHLGGYSVEGDWETLLNSNIIGTYNLLDWNIPISKMKLSTACRTTNAHGGTIPTPSALAMPLKTVARITPPKYWRSIQPIPEMHWPTPAKGVTS